MLTPSVFLAQASIVFGKAFYGLLTKGTSVRIEDAFREAKRHTFCEDDGVGKYIFANPWDYPKEQRFTLPIGGKVFMLPEPSW